MNDNNPLRAVGSRGGGGAVYWQRLQEQLHTPPPSLVGRALILHWRSKLLFCPREPDGKLIIPTTDDDAKAAAGIDKFLAITFGPYIEQHPERLPEFIVQLFEL